MKWMSVAIGGSVGAIARYALTGFVTHLAGPAFPYGTLAVNLLGCFFIGFLASFASDKFSLGEQGQLFLIVGFCGGFTTFSAFIIETATLMRHNENLKALLNISISILAGFAALRVGVTIGELL